MTAAQRQASAPEVSVWVNAHAGTGKTKVLTDRVLRLLLGGTPPERILCLTFTRAAAAEMAARISKGLAAWTVADDAELAADLAMLTGTPPGRDTLDRARRLFAQVLETAGGMKIQTIHAFCQSLLRRFPLEAGIAPHFRIADEPTCRDLLRTARFHALEEARQGENPALVEALDQVTATVGEDGFGSLLDEIASKRARFEALIERHGSVEGLAAAVRKRLDIRDGDSAERIAAAACTAPVFDESGLRMAAAALAKGSKTDQERGSTIERWLHADETARLRDLDTYMGAFLNKEGTPRKTLATKDVAAQHPAAADTLKDEQTRIVALAERRNAARMAESSAALIRFAARHLALYALEKKRQGFLDYEDQIETSRRLLCHPGIAPWVLYKLDGGIDHLLIDEAQDTSRAQWSIAAAFADEFFAGRGGRDVLRTLFAVGDGKQSIFSFQGAEPEAGEAMRAYFRGRAGEAGLPWAQVPLARSFRSTGAVLAAVDAVFARPEASNGVIPAGEALRHEVERRGEGGRVELWPVVAPAGVAEPEPWTVPDDDEADDPAARLAAAIAGTVAGWTVEPEPAEGAWLESRNRRVAPGDVMVLVRRRDAFVDHLLRALKARSVPVAGVDRMVLTEQIAVMDLIALGNSCLLPGDSLTLATVLKSPLVELDEDALFVLAHGRGERNLWQALAEKRKDSPAFAEAARAFDTFRALARTLPPFEFYSEVLGAHGGRRALLARLGPESADAIDEFLTLALQYGRNHAPSLQGFLHWIAEGRAEIARDMEQGRDEVRIMTVHGAKGLQAPIIFLPDTLRAPRNQDRLLWLEESGGDGEDPAAAALLWPGRAERDSKVSRAARENAKAAEAREYRRLLYVAMTRAEDRLYVCGWRNKRKPDDGCWYELVRCGMETGLAGAKPVATPVGPDGLAYAEPQTAAPPEAPEETPPPPRDSAPPAWLHRPPPPEAAPPRPLAPSREGTRAGSPIDRRGRGARERGVLVHRLLECLPPLAPEARRGAAERLLASSGLDDREREELIRRCLSLLAEPAFAPVFVPNALAEAPIAAFVGGRRISGRIDRLLVTEGRVVALDYKSGWAPPPSSNDVPAEYRQQMSAYRQALAAIFPGRTISCGLLFTDAPRLIWLPE